MDSKLAIIAREVEHRLERLFSNPDKEFPSSLFPPFPRMDIMGEVSDMTLRGGKRIRAALVVCGYELLKPDGLGKEQVVDCAAAMEILQSYFLIHDDIMDDDDVRRGGPSVHASLRRKNGSEKAGRDLAILAGDLACAMATSIVAGLEAEGERAALAREVFFRMHLDVIAGQALDLGAEEAPMEVVSRKTASYTTVGPTCMGAALAGADRGKLVEIGDMVRPLGIAFQYRDDLIGILGDERDLGKPKGSDLRNGKRTLLLEEAYRRCDPEGRKALEEVRVRGLGDESVVERAFGVVLGSGAVEACEAEVDRLTKEAFSGLKALDAVGPGGAFLEWLAKTLAKRDR